MSDMVGVTRVLLALLLALGSHTAAPAGAQPAGDPVLVVVGDIAPDPFRPWLGGQDDLATAELVGGLAPDRVLPLGDNQYEFGKIEAFTHPGIRCLEMPIYYGARIGESKLNIWRDGFYNLFFLVKKRFMLRKKTPRLRAVEPVRAPETDLPERRASSLH